MLTTQNETRLPAADARSGRRAFSRGIRQRNPLVLLAAALLTVFALLGIQAMFTNGAWTAVPLKYWMSAANDPNTYVSWTTTQLKRQPPEKPLVVLVGGSSARESIWSGEGLAADIAAAGGPDVEAASLTGMHQTMGGSVAIVDNLPSSPTTVMIGVSLLRVYYDVRANTKQIYGAEYVLESDTLREFAAEKGIARPSATSLLPGIARAMATRAERLSSDLLRGKSAAMNINLHTMDKNKPLTDEKRKAINGWANGDWASRRLEKNLGPTLELLDASITAARARGLDVVLLELPHNPYFMGAGYRETEAYYQKRLRQLAGETGAIYLNFSDDVELSDADFIDFSHLRPSGRTVWQQRLGEELAKLYRSGAISAADEEGTSGAAAPGASPGGDAP